MNLSLHAEDAVRSTAAAAPTAGRAGREPGPGPGSNGAAGLEAVLPKAPPRVALARGAVHLTLDQDVPPEMPWVLLVLPLVLGSAAPPAVALDLDALYGDERELRRFWARARRTLGGCYLGPRTASFAADEWRATASPGSDPERRLVVLLRQPADTVDRRIDGAADRERHDAERLVLQRLFERTAGDLESLAYGLVRIVV